MSETQHREFRGRDASTLSIIGSFFALLAVLVVCGTFFGEARLAARLINVAAAGVLFLIGLGMIFSARRIRRGGHKHQSD